MSGLASILTVKPDPFVIEGTLSTPSDFPQKLDEASQELEKLALEQEDISAHVYSRSAKPENVQIKHRGWKKEISAIQSRLASLERVVTDQFSICLPFMQETAMKEAHEVLICLVDRITSIKEENDTLTKIIQSKNYAEAHAFCRKAIRECEEITSSKDDTSVKKQKCEQLFDEKKREISAREVIISQLTDPQIPHYIRKLHRDVKEFFKYRIMLLSAPAQAQPVQTQPVQPVSPAAASSKPIESVDPSEINYVLTFSTYIQSFAFVTLNPLYGFQNARWFGTEWYQEFKYKPIWDEIEALKLAAKGIQKLTGDLQLAIDQLREGNKKPYDKLKSLAAQTRFFEEVHLHLEKAVKKEKKKLLSSHLTVEVHTGLYYAERLIHALSRAKQLIRRVSRLSDLKYDAALKLQEKLRSFLDCKRVEKNEDPRTEVRAFFDASQYLSSKPETPADTSKYIVEFINRTHQLAKKILATLGRSTLKQELSGDVACKVLLYKEDLSEFCDDFAVKGQEGLPTELKIFIEKELCNWLYYSDRKSCSLLLSLCIKQLENHPKYKEKLDSTLASDQDFKLLVDTYKKLAKPTPVELEFLDHTIEVSNLLSLPFSKHESIFYFAKAAEFINRRKAQELEMVPIVQTVKQILEQKLETTRSSFRFPIPLTRDALMRETLATATDQEQLISRLFSLLTLSLSSDTAATKEIRSFLAARTTPLPELAQTKYLLFLFSISNMQGLSELERAQLPSFFTQYLRDEGFAGAFDKRYNPLALERLLFSNISRDLERTIKNCRGDEGFEAWKKAVQCSIAFQEIQNNRPPSGLRYREALDSHIAVLKPLKTEGKYAKVIAAILAEFTTARDALGQ